MRQISPADFDRIVERGLGDNDAILPRVGDPAPIPGFAEAQTPFEDEQVRERVSQLTSRAVRERAFRKNVLRAYGKRCAIIGLKLINGLGRAEVAAAHIRPVQANGPDVINNGIALSGTIHWMFDRGLIGLNDDLKIQISRHVNDQNSVRALINKTGHASPPALPKQRPHPRFLEWHRENCFKQ